MRRIALQRTAHTPASRPRGASFRSSPSREWPGHAGSSMTDRDGVRPWHGTWRRPTTSTRSGRGSSGASARPPITPPSRRTRRSMFGRTRSRAASRSCGIPSGRRTEGPLPSEGPLHVVEPVGEGLRVVHRRVADLVPSIGGPRRSRVPGEPLETQVDHALGLDRTTEELHAVALAEPAPHVAGVLRFPGEPNDPDRHYLEAVLVDVESAERFPEDLADPVIRVGLDRVARPEPARPTGRSRSRARSWRTRRAGRRCVEPLRTRGRCRGCSLRRSPRRVPRSRSPRGGPRPRRRRRPVRGRADRRDRAG